MASSIQHLALDLGGVLMTDGTKTAFGLMGLRSGQSVRLLKGIWQEELRVPAELGRISSNDVFERLSDVCGLETSEVAETMLGEFRPIPYGIRALELAHEVGTAVILATNHIDEWLDQWRSQFDWFGLLDAVVCSSTLGERKPEPAFYQAVIRAAGDRAGFVFVDDDPENVSAATRAGLHGVLAKSDWARSLGPSA